MGRPLAALIQQKTSTTSPPDDQGLDLFDPTGRQRSLSELAGAGNRRRQAKREEIQQRIPADIKEQLNPKELGRLTDALRDNPDWDEGDMWRWNSGDDL